MVSTAILSVPKKKVFGTIPIHYVGPELLIGAKLEQPRASFERDLRNEPGEGGRAFSPLKRLVFFSYFVNLKERMPVPFPYRAGLLVMGSLLDVRYRGIVEKVGGIPILSWCCHENRRLGGRFR